MEAPQKSPMELAMDALESAFGREHPTYDREAYNDEVERGDTRLRAYWEWVVHQIEGDEKTDDDVVRAHLKENNAEPGSKKTCRHP